MPIFNIRITEHFEKVIAYDADTEHEAIQEAQDDYENGAIDMADSPTNGGVDFDMID
jgi:hypothetical protein